MATRMRKKDANGIFALIVIGGIVWLFTKFTELVGGFDNLVWVGVSIFAVIVVFWILSSLNSKRKTVEKRKRLMDKYGDEVVVNNIMTNSVWIGQNLHQLIDSRGQAEDVDVKVLKTKKKEIWKYGHQGGNRYRLRITIENGIVVGWDSK